MTHYESLPFITDVLRIPPPPQVLLLPVPGLERLLGAGARELVHQRLLQLLGLCRGQGLPQGLKNI